MKPEIPYEIIAKSFSEKLTPEEEQLLRDFKNANSENKLIFAELEAVHQMAGDADFSFEPDIEKALDKVNKQIEPNISENRIKRLSRFWPAAAAILIGMFLYIYTDFSTNNTAEIITIETGRAETKELVLPDGSKISLAALSSIEYPEQFSDENRTVKFEGTGYFSIQKNAKKPFIIKAEDKEVKVLGTEFSFKTAAANNRSEIVVTEGLVQFSVKEKNIKVSAGQKGIYNKENKSLMLNKTFDTNEIAWKTGLLKFQNTPIKEAFSFFSEIYNVSIKLTPDVVNEEIDGKYPKSDIKSATELFKIMELTCPKLKIIKKDSIYIVSKKTDL